MEGYRQKQYGVPTKRNYKTGYRCLTWKGGRKDVQYCLMKQEIGGLDVSFTLIYIKNKRIPQEKHAKCTKSRKKSLNLQA